MSPYPSGLFKPALVAALVLIVTGCAGDDSLGEMIFDQGHGEHGRLAYSQGPKWLAHGEFGCATCHGPDGTGRSVRAGSISASAPAITANALLARGYDRQALRRALADGVTPAGRPLNAYMPRWSMTDAEFAALARFLEGL